MRQKIPVGRESSFKPKRKKINKTGRCMYFTSSCQRRRNSVYQITFPPPPAHHWKVITEYCVSENAVGAFGRCLILPSSCGNGPSRLLVYSLFVSPLPAESDESHNNLRIWMLHYWLNNGSEYRRTALSWKHLCFFPILAPFPSLNLVTLTRCFQECIIYTTARCVRSVQVGAFICQCVYVYSS